MKMGREVEIMGVVHYSSIGSSLNRITAASNTEELS